MKTIYQLAKVGKRLTRIARKSTRLLMNGRTPRDWPRNSAGRVICQKRNPLRDGEAAFERARLGACAQGALLLKEEMDNRRINQTAFRCALPLKKQRELLATMNSDAAQKLLVG